MKKFLMLGICCCFIIQLQAQNLGRRIVLNTKNQTEGKVESKTSETVDKAFNKMEEGVNNLFKKKDKSPEGQNESESEGQISDQNGMSSSGQSGELNPGGSSSPSLQTYSNFDFIPGERVIAFEDFSQDAVGDFPARWNTNSSGEVVTIDGLEGKWMVFADEGVLYPEFVEALPENCTIEFDLAVIKENAVLTKLMFIDENQSPNLLDAGNANSTIIELEPIVGNTAIFSFNANGDAVVENTKPQKQFFIPEGEEYTLVKVSIWKQKSRLRVYLNESKVWDIPRAFQAEGKYRFALGTATFFIENREFLMSNLRFAVGQPDTRSKLITDGKFITQGIVFDSGSASIKPESFGVLKEIASVLSENPSVNVHIIGHTDSDGDLSLNQSLSQKRAESVKSALSGQFGIDASRMSTEGKGESEPIADNGSPDGKAQNRRVEFIKK
ncbi:MAG: OmpA family protein [Cytophagales bacterium]|nr:MAG: OmpA family protein [Cytophagales bacterium]